MSANRHEALQAEILGYAHDWQTVMNLGWLSITHAFLPSFKDDSAETIGDTEAYWQYRQAKITWYLASASRLTPELLESTVVHELVHCLTAPMESHVKAGHDEHTEFAVESLARAFIEVRNASG